MVTSLIAGFCLSVLSVIAVAHAYWAFGGVWPARDPAGLARTVIGSPGLKTMPAWFITLPVAVLILAAGLIAAARGLLGWDSALLIRLPLAGLALVFLIRGAITYLPSGPFAQASAPFRSLNRFYYSPLVLALAACFASLALLPA